MTVRQPDRVSCMLDALWLGVPLKKSIVYLNSSLENYFSPMDRQREFYSSFANKIGSYDLN